MRIVIGLAMLAGLALAACGSEAGAVVEPGSENDAGPSSSVSAATCTATTCNGHGTCEVKGSSTACTCQAGYGGASCAECPAGMQDKDGDKTCAPACAATTCNGHGTCNDSTGTAICACTSPYAGAHCDEAPSCQADSCNGHGTCADDTASIACTCDVGYTGPACANCEAGYQSNDATGTCTAKCTESTCNGHGTCSDAGGSASCTCSTNWAGPDCASCTPNFTGAQCDTCVAGKYGPNCDYSIVYGLNIPVAANWNTPADVPYDVDNSGIAGAFTRVAYRMVLDDQSVWVEMDAFATTKTELGIPTDWIFDKAVTNMSVISTAPNTPSVAGPVNGRIEFWSLCYNTGGGNGALYDYDDDYSGYAVDCYGSFQIHTGITTVLAYNGWSYGATSDVGFGNQSVGHPDWTQSYNASKHTTRRLEVFVK